MVNYDEDLFVCLKIWCMPSIYWTSKGKVVKQLLSFIHLSILVVVVIAVVVVVVVVVVCSPSLSLAAEATCISVFPGFWLNFPNDPCTGTTNDLTVACINSSVHVGKCSIARPCFS